MNRKIATIIFAVIALAMNSNAYAFDWSSLKNALSNGTVENIVNGVIGTSDISIADIEGSWSYKAPAVAFESEDLLKKAGGSAIATTIENKLSPYYQKFGMKNIVMTFNSDSTFVMQFKKGKLTGKLTKEGDDFYLNYDSITKIKSFKSKVHIKKRTTLEITYDVSKLLTLMSSVAKISGNSTAEKSVFVDGRTYEFKSTLFDLGGQAEFNFFNFGIGSKYKNLKRLTPYLTLGLGVTMASCSGSTAVAMNLPMGVGVKYKLKERLNLGAEFTMRKCFGDKIDGLSDLNGIKSSFAKNTDWYSLIQVSVTYEFGKRCRVCHYVD